MGRQPSDCCILVVEDDPIFRYVTVKTLRRIGYKVLEAADGLEALWIVEQQHDRTIDLLISDLNMPRMDGNALAHEMRRGRPDLQVIIVTGCMVDDFALDLTNYVVDVMPKPVNPRALTARVAALLGT